ncbi:MAG: glutamate-1-semialdehyde 2,1-aminomutase [Methanomassiliicoccales archaeon]|nr:glutamate-1-semialdehyde 2,1-aminomutase [Methanomassiliicoccales archaeon]
MSTERSSALYQRAVHLMPGGVSSPVRAVKPYPLYMKRGEGSHIFDEDGNGYLDMVLGFGPLILGHSHPDVVRALQEQLLQGTLFGAPCEKEVLLAEKVRSHVPSMEMLRFVNSGTEATMHAVRLARGYTGRRKIIKVDGGFHGAHDSVLVRSGSGALTHGSPDSLGVTQEVARNTLGVNFNDMYSMRNAFRANKGDIAAVIIEPMLGNVGPVPPLPGYLQEVRELTERHASLLIFDEVITGFRLHMGGAQALFGVRPDITVLGKVLGGGMPIGAFGGRKDIMSMVSPLGRVYQAGTFSGNPMSLTAGLATLGVLEREGLEGLDSNGEYVRERLTAIISEMGMEAVVQGLGSTFQLFFRSGEVKDSADALASDRGRYMELYRRMLADGHCLPPSPYETCFLSTAHSRPDIDGVLDAFRHNLEGLP